MIATPYTPKGFRWLRRLRTRVRPWGPLDTLGFVLGFCWQVLSSIPFALQHYRSQTMMLITDMTWGRGSIVVGGGTAAVMGIMGAAVGASTGIEAYSALNLVSLGQVTGVISAFANTRELAPIAAGVGFAAQAGCRMTAEIGSMRISEEIDAIESLGVRSVAFVVATRVIAGLVAIVPTFLIALILSYFACAVIVVRLHDQPAGVYDHYFTMFVVSWDVVAAVVKVAVFAVAVIVIHCYQGFFATGGPEGVGIASGRAIRASLVAIIALNMVMTLALWGFTSPVRFAG
ncbi:phospholipid/cholesterol/gamma-HCH transport system permease protein [Nocardia tenerifensis]|uniref:Phospholipid/cholesterol/gamma-HCH transport system permease protein n=1 Tax=Nocardia tenerifensis TaxID=228006 RepID=A0A318JVW3_9NOCA|nr:ABC transporter permease [Nocardia tenerifensis]PXX58453.1 phospholipid/cholesterol/gamma-HCH transport system permease protein [Nocardia tenerifensis]